MKRIVSILTLFSLVFSTLLLGWSSTVQAASTTISNFESNSRDGWSKGTIVTGYNSQYALRLTNAQNNSIETKKTFNSTVLKGYSKIELDINLNGTKILDGDASGLIIDQSGWKIVSLSKYVQNSKNGWQHISVPLSDYTNLDTSKGIASMIIRFWNDKAGQYDIDNITLTSSTQPGLIAPTNLTGQASSTSQINLSWDGQGPKYKVYRNNQVISTITAKTYSDQGLAANTSYTYYIKSTDGTTDSAASNTISVKTLDNSIPVTGSSIADFETGMEGFNQGQLVSGYNSNKALRLTHNSYSGTESKKIINSVLLKGKQNLELDINLNGSTLLNNDASAIVFEQAGWKMASLSSYVNNGKSGWQHVRIPLSSFTGLNTNEGVAYILFRFWNNASANYDIDNITLTGSGGTVDPVQTPTNLQASYRDNAVYLTWSGTGPSYKIFRNNSQIGTSTSPNYSDSSVSPNTTYSYFVKATNGTADSSASNSVSITTPADNQVTGWQIQSIDSQIMSKYWQIGDTNQIRSLVKANKALGAETMAISINYNYYPLMKKWADVIHSEGMNVWFRGHWNEWDTWEDPAKKTGITATEYLNKTKQFIIDHPTLFKAGDIFTMAGESENAAWHTGIDRGAFTGWESWKEFTRSQISYSNSAFNQIGLGGKVKTNLINMNGWVAWNILDQNTVNTLGVLTLDHIIDWTDDINTYKTSLFQGNTSKGYYGYDQYYNKWHVPIIAGEWGYSTFNGNLSSSQQKAMAQAVFDEFAKRSYIQGVNYWIDVGHASRLFDTQNLLDYTPRPITAVIKQYYN